MHKTTLSVSILAAAALALALLHGFSLQRPASSTTAPANTTVLLWMGTKATGQERWDGAATSSGGTIRSIRGRHFSDGDEILPGNRWKAVTRVDRVAPYADVHYTEMRPGSTPEVRHHPVGVLLEIEGPARVRVETAQGNFDFSVAELGLEPMPVLNGKATLMRVPTPERLSQNDFEDDEPSIAAQADGRIAVAWVAYRQQADRIFVRMRGSSGWSAPEEVTLKPADIFRTSLAATRDGVLWVFWAERDNERWHLWGRAKRNNQWGAPERISDSGSATFHRAAAAANGAVYVVWQSLRNGQSDIYLRAWENGNWQPEVRLSESSANDWEPALAAAPDGAAFVAWDSYDQGHYDVHVRSYRGGRLSPLTRLTSGPAFQAHAAVAVDAGGRPWVAWNEGGVNWGKDQGFLIPMPLATPLHQQRWLKVVYREGERWMEPQPLLEQSLPPPMRRNAEHPQLQFGQGGALALVFRHWTRRNSRQIGSPMVWENYLTTFDGRRWTHPKPLPESGSWIEKHAALTRTADGQLWAAWMTDQRPFATMVPGNADVYAARLDDPGALGQGILSGSPYQEPFQEAIPAHNNEPADVKAIRTYVIESAGRRYRIFRGDMHRHTDISTDFKYDGSLFEVYRYALDAAGFDYVAPTDHQTGFDQEYSWWQNQKYVDLFHMPGVFVPLFGYERSVRFPNGHRNVIWAKRGFRTLPIPPEEAAGKEGAKKLYANLRQTGGISMPHSMATDQGTDWRDNDPELEPLVEIYQGYRASYEYEGAPKAATELNQQAQKSGWQPSGFFWNALAKGYKLGVQASSDHWSTHISYACLLVEGATREHLLDAIRKRHAYAATDNIILDFRARAGGQEHIMGDAFRATAAPQLSVNAVGTATLKQIDLVKDKRFVYTTRPGTKSVRFTFTDTQKGPGESWYYVRVLQEDGQIAWSSPIWITR